MSHSSWPWRRYLVDNVSSRKGIRRIDVVDLKFLSYFDPLEYGQQVWKATAQNRCILPVIDHLLVHCTSERITRLAVLVVS